MAVESAQMADLNKMVAPKPAASVSPGKVRRPPSENFKGCKCPTWRCKNGNCPCYAASYSCTSKCECVECVNTPGDRGGGDSNTGPVTWCRCTVTRCAGRHCRCLKASQRCNSKCECRNCDNRDGVRGSEPDEAVHTTPPSNIESEQPEFISSWVAELMQAGIDPNKQPRTQPSSGIEPEQAHTSSMVVESAQMADLNKMVAPKPAASVSPGKVRRTLPENFKGCKCPTWRCKNGNCPCYAGSLRCSSKCECGNCDNRDGVRGSEPDEAVHTTPPSNVESEQPDFISSRVAELMQGGFDPNKRPRTQRY